MALEILSVISPPVTEVGKSLFGAIRRQIRYVTKYKENVSTLEKMEEKLDAKRGGLQLSVDEASWGLKVISPEVVIWLQKVVKTQDKLRGLHVKLNENKKSIRARRKLSIQLLNMVAEVRNLCEEEFSVIVHDPPQPAVLVNRTSSNKVNVHSRKLIMDEVMKELEDGTISSIGVHGMGGIGKTTLMHSVNNELRGSQLFKKVIMVTVSKEPDVKVVQDRIAERLGLQLGKNSAPLVRADKLFERLKAEESVLIILDDIWKRLDTLAIGVPSHPGCKVLLTTRDLDVCRRMQVQKTIKMEILSDKESWMIFEEKVGDAVNFPNLGNEIVRRCNGSPLAIAVLGLTLRDAPEYVWTHALNVLKNPNATGLEGIMPGVVTSLRLSFDHLPNPNVKLCFLYCCMFAEDENISVSELRDYGIGDGFLSMEDATNELLYFVKILKDRNLLLDGDNEMSVKMHDVVRDVAMSIASEDNYGFFVSAGGALPESSSAYQRISMIQNKENVLSNPLEYPKLSTLIIKFPFKFQPGLQPKSKPEIQPESGPTAEDDFFLGCPALRILSMLRAPLVPKSISQLTNLRTLYLPRCDLRNRVYLLGGLTNLQVLVLRGSKLGRLVEEFGNLRNLRVLDLEEADIDYIAPGFFSRLSKLEELRMWRSFEGKWGSVGPEGKPNAGFAEVTTLVHLSILYITAVAVEEKAMSNLLWLNKLKQFRVVLNSSNFGFWGKGNFVHIAKANLGNHGNNMSFADSQGKTYLALTECYGFKSFTRFEGFSQLSFLTVYKCDEIEYLIDGGFSNNSFESLEQLSLIELRGMKNILRGETSSTSLGRLREIIITKCPNITTVFPASLLFPIARLEYLEHVHVHDCALLQNIFNTEGERGLAEGPESNSHGASPGEGLLSEVRSISLSDLPEMISIWKGVIPSGSLQGLTVLSVSKCHSLIYLLSSDMVRCLQKLEEISVEDCSKMEKLIHFTCKEAEETVCLEKLRCIRITACPNIIPSHLLFLEERHKTHKLEALKLIYNEIPWSYQFPSIKITFESFFLLEEGLRSDNSSLQLTATTQFKEMHMIGWDQSTIEGVIKSGVLSRFVDFLSRDDFPELQYEAVSFLANLVSGTSYFIEIVIDHGVVPVFVKLLSSRSDQIKEQALRALGNISGGSPDWRDLFLEHDVFPGLVSLLQHSDPSVLIPALRTIADIIRKDSMQIQCILDHQVLPYLLNVLIEFNHMENIQKAAFSIISCITAGSEMQIQAVITANIIGLLIQQSKTAEFNIKKEAVWAITNAICGGSSKQIKNLVSLGCITPICDLLVCPDTKLVVACLQAIDKILKVGKTETLIGKDGVSNIYMQFTGDCGGLEKIKNLRGHEITEIHEKAVSILKIYWIQEGALPSDDEFPLTSNTRKNELPVPSRPLNEAPTPSIPLGAVKELEGGTEERESEQDTMPYEIDSNKSPSEQRL